MPQEKYKIFDKMIEGVQIISPEWKYLYVNETVTKHGKFSEEELLGHTMMEKYPGIEKTEMFIFLEKCMSDGAPHQMVNEFDFPDGSKGYFELRMQRIEEGVLISSFDITEVKRAEQLIKDTNRELEQKVDERTKALQESEERFQLAVDGTSAGIWDWISIERDEEWWSPRFYELLGYENGEIEASLSNFGKMLHPDDSKKTFKALDDHFEHKGKFEVEYRLKTKSGEYKWFLGSGQAEWDSHGKPCRMVGTIIDINERKKSSKLLEEKSKELEKKNQELKEFVYIASHDLQEPMRTIASMVNLFEESHKKEVGEDGQTMLRFMKEATDRSQNLIVDLLDYSRIGTSKSMEQVDMNTLATEAIADLGSKINEKGAKIIIGKLPELKGLKTELRLLLQNLLGNAIKFSKPNLSPKISISAKKEGDNWEFKVKDNGIGFDKKYNQKVFEVFKRLNNSKDYQGTGIGLAQCKRIIELHNGKIWAESELGKGSTFYFTLPSM